MAHARAFAPSTLDATDFSALEPHYRELLGRTLSSADDLEQLILDRSDLDALVAEKAANLYIATTRNTEDKSAEGAFLAFVRDVEPKLKPVASELDRKIATSAFADALPKDRYEVLLRAMRIDIELFREANIPLETELAELDQKYNQIIGRMTVDFDGTTRTMAQMSRLLEETDRALRERAWKAIAARRLADRDAIDDIYDRMLALRQRIATNAGFDNFRDFQHRRFKRFDYTPADCMSMHAAIEAHLVPIQRRLDRERSRDLGLPTLRPWDLSVDVKGRAPLRPFDGAQQLIDGCWADKRFCDDREGNSWRWKEGAGQRNPAWEQRCPPDVAAGLCIVAPQVEEQAQFGRIVVDLDAGGQHRVERTTADDRQIDKGPDRPLCCARAHKTQAGVAGPQRIQTGGQASLSGRKEVDAQLLGPVWLDVGQGVERSYPALAQPVEQPGKLRPLQ